MSEEQKETTEGKESDKKPDDTDKGDKYETTPVIERAREEREKLEAANEKKEKLLNREEAIMAKRALGGTTEAGQSSEPVKTEGELAKEYVKKNFENLR